MDERLVAISWTDCSFDLDWDPGEPFAPMAGVTVGYLISEEPAFMHVASERMGESWRAVTHIPRQLITAVADLWTQTVPEGKA